MIKMDKKVSLIKGRGIVIRGDDIDTDRIVPARYLKEVTFENMGQYAFYDERFDEKGTKKEHPFNDKKSLGAQLMIVNKNFGCGSSREHAPQSIMRWGIKAIIGESFGEIFTGNCAMLGIPNCSLNSKNISEIMDYVEKNSNEPIEVDVKAQELKYGINKVKMDINPSLRDSLLNGTWDATSVMLKSKEQIREVASKLPYLTNFK